ncbi:hypothetical protein [Parasphingorhabdus flavimaris]|uniref:hypothetical protein n=1 Tax=Parasphingorhabdus flavimaris TaxID=266812 RepID=UPI0030030D8C
MQFLEQLLKISSQDVSELQFRIQRSQLGYEITSGQTTIGSIVGPNRSVRSIHLDRYLVKLVYSGHSGENQISALKYQAETESSLGYVFPINSLTIEREFETDWEEHYANIAFYDILENQAHWGFVNEIQRDQLREGDLQLGNFISDNLSVVVFGRSNLRKFELDEKSIDLVLIQAGVIPAQAYLKNKVELANRDWHPTIPLRNVSSKVLDEVEVLTSFVLDVSSDGSTLGRFLGLYQIIEFFSGKVFEDGIEYIRNNDADQWVIKDRLSKIQSDKFRLSRISERIAVLSSVNLNCDKLRRACAEMMAELQPGFKKDDNWINVLYKTRNIVVHNQIALAGLGLTKFVQINKYLASVCLDLLFHFDEADFDGLWQLPN